MEIRVLGPLEVRAGDDAYPVPGTRVRALLVALALQPGRVVQQPGLIDWIWDQHPPAGAANALQRLVSRLRSALPGVSIEGRGGGYRLVLESDAVDAVRFERLLDRARATDGVRRVRVLREALGMWRGPALADVAPDDNAAIAATATRLERLRLSAVEDRFEAEVDLGHGPRLIPELTDAVAAHPLRERLVAALMRALAEDGRDTDALLAHQRIREDLAETLGADPGPELSALHVALLRGELGPRERDRSTNLPAELTSYVGKDADLAAVGERILQHRLTTLIGPGGAGKTRLATETARSLLGDLPGGAWLVELAAVGADADVAQATLTALGLRDGLLGPAPNVEPVDRLIAALRDRELLLVVDNCEHLVDAAALFAHRVLLACPGLRILATSREPLGITGESLWPVAPLPVPEERADQREIESAAAVRLLRDRAAAVRPTLTVDARTLSTMARVCRALDGMPLAIELAAARLRTMTLDQLADRLDDRLGLLTTGSRTAMARHRTLRAVVDWSWELLTDAERTVLRRLSVFAGGASPAAAERVCSGNGVERDEVAEVLGALAEKSLVISEGERAPRHRMLGAVREYAADRLAEAQETDLARRAHLEQCTELVETAEPHLRQAEQLAWLAVLEEEHDNITAAMRGALAAGEADPAMRLAAGAGWYWWLTGHRAEGLELIMAATRLPGAVPDQVRAMVYALIVQFITSGRGDQDQAGEWIRKAHRFSRDGRDRHPLLGLVTPLERMVEAPDEVLPAFEHLLADEDPWVRALARLQLGKMRTILGHGGPEADEHLELAVADFRALGERYGTAFALTERAERMAMRGDFGTAADHYREAIAAVTRIGTREDVLRMLSRQAQLYWLLGDPDASTAAIDEAERLAARVTWPEALAEVALAKAELARWRGEVAESRSQLDVATDLLGEDADWATIRALTHDLRGYLTDDPDEARRHRAAACEAASEVWQAPLIAQVLVGVADLALRTGQHEQAARLLAAGVRVCGLADRSRPDAARIERAAREHLGAARFAEATREGAAADWPELVARTLSC